MTLKLKYRTGKTYKGTVSGNKAGVSRKTAGARVSVYPDPQDRRLRGATTKRVVVNRVPTGMQGTPQGKCLGAAGEGKCACGKHNRKG